MSPIKIKKAAGSAALLLLSLFFLQPFYLVVVNAFKNRAEITLSPLKFPKTLDFSYFKTAIDKMDFAASLKNSFIITFLSVFFIVILSSATAWWLVRRSGKLSSIIFFTFIATMLIPFQAIMMPLMQFMGTIQSMLGIKLLNSHIGLIYMHVGFSVGMTVFLYHGFIKSVPVTIEEAGVLDGCNTWQLFWFVVFPMLKNTTITALILNAISIWNDYLLPSLVLSSKELRTIPLSTFSFFGEFTIQWNLAMAGLTLTIIPVIVFYVAAQKYIVAGVASGAVKQ